MIINILDVSRCNKLQQCLLMTMGTLGDRENKQKRVKFWLY